MMQKSTGNNRVDSLLECARKNSLTVKESEWVENCWTIQGNNGHSLTVYGGPNHTATVMGDLPGQRDWVEVTQRDAKFKMANGTFFLETK